MNIVVEHLKEGKVVRVNVGYRLDLTAYKHFNEVTVCAVDDPRIVAIVVDFSGTQHLFDSGKAILFDLIMRANYLKIPLRLVQSSLIDLTTANIVSETESDNDEEPAFQPALDIAQG